ncbi:MAG: hypothetical protein ACLVH9_04665 [Fusobacterium sp.]|uniref:hypothetical protein n=1 Tax=Fusobacterium sp. TaxID=68766 RepID=UPI00399ACAA9
MKKFTKNKYQGFMVIENPDIPYDIKFSLINPNCRYVPKESAQLYYEIEKILSDLKVIFKDNDEELKKNFKLVLSLAQGGLAGRTGNPQMAKKSLNSLKNDILTVYGQKLKTKYIYNLGKTALFFDIITYILYSTIPNPTFKLYLIVLMGTFIGSWISFCIRKLEIKFDDLVHFEKDLMPYFIRLIFIGIVSVIFAMIINNEIITILFSDFSLKGFFLTKEKSLLFGILCGLVDIKLATNLYKKSEKILNIKE